MSWSKEKQLFKSNIEMLINSGDLENSKKLITQYDSIDDNDIDIVSMKAVIMILESNMDGAEELLWKGVELDHNNSDILFNLGYLYEVKGEYRKAINFIGR